MAKKISKVKASKKTEAKKVAKKKLSKAKVAKNKSKTTAKKTRKKSAKKGVKSPTKKLRKAKRPVAKAKRKKATKAKAKKSAKKSAPQSASVPASGWTSTFTATAKSSPMAASGLSPVLNNASRTAVIACVNAFMDAQRLGWNNDSRGDDRMMGADYSFPPQSIPAPVLSNIRARLNNYTPRYTFQITTLLATRCAAGSVATMKHEIYLVTTRM